MKKDTIHDYIDSLQARGQYFFAKKGLLSFSRQTEIVANRSLARLQARNRLLLVRRGFYIIIPIEFRLKGVLPPEWWIHFLMDYIGLPYYAGLLSAAAIWGASHQKPQEFQVVTNCQLRSIQAGILRIRFFKKAHFPDPAFLINQKTETGYMKVSNPELTAFDLMKYVKGVGGLNLLATTLSELGENIDPQRLLKAARKEKVTASVQRLGFLLDKVGFGSKTKYIHEFVRRKNAPLVLLEPSRPKEGSPRINKWNIIENIRVETDLI